VDISKALEPIAAEMAAAEAELGAVAARIASSDGARPAPLGILDQISRHPFAVPGKRLRPALVLLSYRAAADRATRGRSAKEAAVGLAAAVEILHSASLVHDDIIDGAEERRHQVSLNKRFGDRVAVLAGDILYTEFFSLVAGLPLVPALGSRILSLFLSATKKMCVGEILAQEARSSDGAAAAAGKVLGFEEYLEISEYKTASLFAACCEGGALVGGAGEEETGALGEFGLLFGLTFQMLDDLADRDHALDPGIDLRARTEEYATRTKAAAAALGPAAAGISELLEYVVARNLHR
jgi:octaprenyl-diphosphate synthase